MQPPPGAIVFRLKMIDFFNMTAHRVHGMPEDWRWCQLDGHDKPEDFIEVKGSIPIGQFKSGPRKGRTKWPKELQTIWMRRREIDRVRDDWESENHTCHKCEGSGEECYGFSKHQGRKMRTCQRCNGTGKPPVTTETK